MTIVEALISYRKIAIKEEIEKTPVSKEYLGKLQYKVH